MWDVRRRRATATCSARSVLHPEQTFAPSAVGHDARGPVSGVNLNSPPDPSRTFNLPLSGLPHCEARSIFSASGVRKR
jgi:hypothetical protein